MDYPSHSRIDNRNIAVTNTNSNTSDNIENSSLESQSDSFPSAQEVSAGVRVLAHESQKEKENGDRSTLHVQVEARPATSDTITAPNGDVDVDLNHATQQYSQSQSNTFKPRRPSNQRHSSYIRRLELDAALEREKFGLADLHVSTSPYEEEVYIELPEYKTEAATEAEIIFTPHSHPHPHDAEQMSPVSPAMISSADMSKQDTIRAPISPSSQQSQSQSQLQYARTPAPAIAVPTTSRMRNPVPPSPLSKVSSTVPEHTSSSSSQTSSPHPTDQSRSLGLPSQNTAFLLPQSSPCFIHSHLDKHGSLQDWLNSKASNAKGASSGASVSSTTGNASSSTSTYKPHHSTGNATKPSRQPSYNQYMQNQNQHANGNGSDKHHNHAHFGSPPSSRITSPKMKATSSNGYDSDQSSANGAPSRFSGSAILDGDLIDDDEEAGSLTRQLAETAQGVREMSKELGRTRVRSKIQHVLIVTKARDNRLIKLTRELALYLMQKRPATSPDGTSRPSFDGRDRGMVVYVDAQLRTSKRFDAEGLQRDYPQLFQPIHRRRSSSSASVNTLGSLSAYPSTANMSDFSRKNRDEGQLRYWTAEMCSNSPHLFDFVVTLGGDGTVLFTSWLFQRIVPPILPFALGSLGFLTNFDFAQYKQTMDKVIDDGIRVNLRMRFTCTVYRAVAPEEAAAAAAGKGGKKRKAIKKPGGEILMSCVDKQGWESLEGASTESSLDPEGRDKEIMCFSTRPVEQFEVLNDLVVDRGPSPYVSLLELFGDEHHLTTVQADGLTVSTPTGSTAYSLSAGGSLVHPQIPALLITPICPHTLSFRPMLLPDSMELRICVPYNSRSTAWASFDGRGRVELKQGDHIKVTASKYPFPTVCADKASTDWFSSISRTLRWNEREKQKSFVVVEEDSEPAPDKGHGADAKENKKQDQKHLAHRSERAKKEKPKEDHELEEQTVEDEEEDEEDDDEEEEEEFDIDDKSGGETAPTSPPMQPTPQATAGVPAQKLTSSLLHTHGHKSGVETPGRFATPYTAPPPLSQRHLVDALHAAEIREKENELGQRDDIRSEDSRAFRVDHGHHLIPSGRSSIPSPTTNPNSTSAEGEDSRSMMMDQKTPRPSTHHHHQQQTPHGRPSHHHHHNHNQSQKQRIPLSSPSGRNAESKSKAFAFFGQDDSASDMSDDHSDA